MNLEALTRELLLIVRTGAMETGGGRAPMTRADRPGKRAHHQMQMQMQMQQGQGQLHRTKSFQSGYFSLETFLALVCLAASLLILPLVLPPLSPPPLMFLLVPIGIMAVLMLLAFMPSDVRNIASSYL